MFILKYFSFIIQMKFLNVELKFYFWWWNFFFLSVCLKCCFPTQSQGPTRFTWSTPTLPLLNNICLTGVKVRLYIWTFVLKIKFLLKLWIAMRPLYVQVYSYRKLQDKFSHSPSLLHNPQWVNLHFLCNIKLCKNAFTVLV